MHFFRLLLIFSCVRKGLFTSISALCFLLYCFNATGQGFRNLPLAFEYVTSEDGLSSSTVWDIKQDSSGFIWLATSYGLNRYDGKSFRHYTHDPRDKNTIGANQARHLHVAANNDIWLTTQQGGVDCLLQTKDIFVRHRHEPKNSNSISSNAIRFFFTDSRGRLWIGTDGGLDLYRPGTNDFLRVHEKSQVSLGIVYEISEDHLGNIWLATEAGIRFVPFNNVETIVNPAPTENWSAWTCRSLVFDKFRKHIWVGTQENGLLHLSFDQNGQPVLKAIISTSEGKAKEKAIWHVFLRGDSEVWLQLLKESLIKLSVDSEGNTVKGKFFNYAPDKPGMLSHPVVYKTLVDSKNELWVGTDGGGLNRLAPDGEGFIQYMQQDNLLKQLSSNSVLSLFEDRQQGIWIGTFGGGISHISFGNKGFEHFQMQAEPAFPKGGLQNPLILEFAQASNGKIWVATNGGGLHLFDPEKRFFEYFRHDPRNPNSLINDKLATVMEDNTGKVWIGTSGSGLDIFDPSTGKFTHFDTDDGLADGFVFSVFQDKAGRVWVGSRKGLDLWVPEEGRFMPFKKAFKNQKNAPDFINIWDIMEDSSGRLWFASEGIGLTGFHPEKQWLANYQYDAQNASSLSSNEVWTVLEDAKGQIWAGTNNGLNLLESEEGNFRNFSTREGLPNNAVVAGLLANNGEIWIATKGGLSLFNPDEYTFLNFKKVDGLQSDEFFPAALKGQDGAFYFGGINGFNRFFPQQIQQTNPYIPQLAFTRLLVDNVEILPGDSSGILRQSIHLTDSVELHYTQRLLTLEFAAFNYRAPEANRYAYRLLPQEEEWRDGGTEGRAIYTNLSPGAYTLEVKGSNNDRVWNENPLRLHIYIPPPWWKTVWAQVLVLFSLIATFAAIIIIRFKSLKAQQEKLEKLVKERTYEIAQQNEEITSQQQAIMTQNLELENRNHQLEDLNRQRDGMMHVVAHDLKSPLNRLKGVLQILQLTGGNDNQEQTEYFDMGYRVVKDGLTLINDLLDLYDFEQPDRAKLRIQTVQLQESIQHITSSYANALAEKELQLHLDTSAISFETDRMCLERILDNLLSNAIKFSERRKSVNIIAEEKGDTVYIHVKDEGPGISEEDQKKLYQMFTKLSARPTGGESSNGLGLAIVKTLTHRLHGNIAVTSKIDEGTRFSVSFPKVWPLPSQDENGNETSEKKS